MRWKLAILASCAAGLLTSAALAQATDAPPVITNIVVTVTRADTGATSALDLDNPPRERDLITVTVTVDDADLPDGDLFARKQSFFIPFSDVYRSPEPGPVDGDSEGYLPAPIVNITGMTATLVWRFQIPEFIGANQARLRGLINYDVRWFVDIRVATSEDPDAWAEDGFDLTAIEDPDLNAPNPPPLADAGPDQTVVAGSEVTLDGSRSVDRSNIGFSQDDPDVFVRDTLQYDWEWYSGPTRVEPTVRDPAHPAVATVTLDRTGTYTFKLTVQDGVNPQPSSDTVRISVVSTIPENHPPKAVVHGPSGSVQVGDVITLDGTGSSDPDGDELHFRWTQTNEVGGLLETSDIGQFQPLSGVESPISMWQATRAGTYYFRLLVSDGQVSDNKRISVTVVDSGSSAAQASGNGSTQSVNQNGQPDGSGDSAAPVAPAGCGGGGLLPLMAIPAAIGAMRGRRR